MKKSIVLLSGGLDSAVSLAAAVKRTKVILALTFNYGQKAAEQEIKAAKRISKYFGIKNRVIDLPWLAEITDTSLVSGKKIPKFTGKSTAAAVWVPDRNLVFVSIAASFAESLKADIIVTGFNREEGREFPDNSGAFVNSVNRTLKLSTLKHPELVSYMQELDKKGIVKLGIKLGAPLHLVYSCYEGDHKMCDKCESCVRFKRAFDEAARDWIKGQRIK